MSFDINNLQMLQQTRAVRLLQVLILTALTIDFLFKGGAIVQDYSPLFLTALMLVVLAVLLIPLGPSVTPITGMILLGTHFILTATVLIFLSPVFGPYFQLLILLILASVAWLNSRGALYSVLLSLSVIATAIIWQGGDIGPVDQWQAGLYMSGLAILAFLFDRITTRQRLEEAEGSELDESYYLERNRLMSLVNSMADGVIATDQDGKVSLYNAAALDLLDTNADINGMDVREFLRLNDEEDVAVDIISEANTAKGAMSRDDMHLVASDNSRIDLSVSVSHVYSAYSGTTSDGYILLMRDITKQKTLDEQRDEFISVASHELRTPIAIAEANISTALLPKFSEDLSEEGHELLEQAHENVVFLSTLVNDLHVLAQAEQGRLSLNAEEMDLHEFLNQFADGYRKQAEEKGLEFSVDIAEDTPVLCTSKNAVKEILQNFMTNALKYTESGTVRLFAYPEDDRVVFGVEDSGIGISEADQKHIYEKFYRSEDYRTRQSGGTGLGLYIIKRMTERLGGDIWFDSKLNKGSTFYCSLPHEMPPQDEE